MARTPLAWCTHFRLWVAASDLSWRGEACHAWGSTTICTACHLPPPSPSLLSSLFSTPLQHAIPCHLPPARAHTHHTLRTPRAAPPHTGVQDGPHLHGPEPHISPHMPTAKHRAMASLHAVAFLALLGRLDIVVGEAEQSRRRRRKGWKEEEEGRLQRTVRHGIPVPGPQTMGTAGCMHTRWLFQHGPHPTPLRHIMATWTVWRTMPRDRGGVNNIYHHTLGRQQLITLCGQSREESYRVLTSMVWLKPTHLLRHLLEKKSG